MTGFKFSELGQINTGRAGVKFTGTAAPAGITWESVKANELSTAFVESKPVSSAPSSIWEFGLSDTLADEIIVGAEKLYIKTDSPEVIALDKESGLSVWTVSLAGESGQAIAADGERVYIGIDDGVRALSTDDGSQEWDVSTGTGRDIKSIKVHDERVYASGETLAVLNAEDGSTVWAKNPIGQVDFGNFNAEAGPMTIGENRVYTNQYQDFGFSFGDVNIVAYDKDDGTRLWTRFPTNNPNEGTGGTNPCMLVNNILVVTYEEESDSDDICEGLAPVDGSVLWKFDPNRTVLSEMTAIAGQDIFMVISGGPDLRGVSISNGNQQWINTDFSGEGLLQGAEPVAFEDTFIFAAGSTTVGVDAATGNELWRSPIGTGSNISCSVGTGAIYVDGSSFDPKIIKLND